MDRESSETLEITAETWRRFHVGKENKSAVNNSRTREAKAKALKEHIKVYREVKKVLKFTNETTSTVWQKEKKTEGSGNMSRLYDTVRKVAGKYSKPERSVRERE